MIFHDLGADAETQSSATLSVFCREERIKDARHVPRVDAAAVVGHFDLKQPAFNARLYMNGTRPASDIIYSVFGIDDQVEHDLLHLMRVAPGVRQIVRKLRCDDDIVNAFLILA